MRALFIGITFLFVGLLVGYFLGSYYQFGYGEFHYKNRLKFADNSYYVGTLDDNGLLSGFGEMRNNDHVYIGEFADAMFNGKGRLEILGRSVYEGDFLDGVATGKVTITHENGSHYEGDVVAYDMHGFGTLTYANGDSYVGMFNKNNMSGDGKLITVDGTSYVGEFENNLYHGKGVLTDTHGNIYDGEFEKGVFHGVGNYQYADGGTYEGYFVKGVFNGKGRFKSRDGIILEGEFDNGALKGQGIYFKGNEWRYVGNFENSILNGLGTHTVKERIVYEGEFENGEYNGSGTLYYDNGDTYTGEFSYGNKHGKGEYTYADTLDGIKTFAGEWSYDSLIDTDGQFTLIPKEKITEHVIYNQLDLLDESIHQLKENDPLSIEFYSLVVAGDGTQEVFRRESTYLKNTFLSEMPLQTIYLTNSRRNVDEAPIATVTSIKKSLMALSRVMDKDNDILFVYLTSHGRENKISLQHEGISLEGIQAENFSKMLDQTNIKWKVIILSACYSGSFIDELSNDHTLIITSAAHDKTSFGCSDNNQFTYFGEAFFKESLPTSYSFIEAFEKSKILISQWEKEQEYEESLPQIHKPKALLEQLMLWEKAHLLGRGISSSPVDYTGE